MQIITLRKDKTQKCKMASDDHYSRAAEKDLGITMDHSQQWDPAATKGQVFSWDILTGAMFVIHKKSLFHSTWC